MKQLLPPFVLRARVWRIQNCALTFVYVNYQRVPIYLFEMIKIDSLRVRRLHWSKSIHIVSVRFQIKIPLKIRQCYRYTKILTFVLLLFDEWIFVSVKVGRKINICGLRHLGTWQRNARVIHCPLWQFRSFRSSAQESWSSTNFESMFFLYKYILY